MRRAPCIDETLMDRIAHRHQEVPGFGRLADTQELPCPFADFIVGVGIVTLNGSLQVERFVWIV